MEIKSVSRKGFFGALIAGFTYLGDAAKAGLHWPKSAIWKLPASTTRRAAWTVDDGGSTSSIKSYVELLENNPNIKMTFFVLSRSPGWATYATRLKALQDSGQIQIANHTHHHKVMTKLTKQQIINELMECERFCIKHFGKTTKPYFRPPFGEIDERVAKIAASIGFTKPVLWYGSFASGAYVKSSKVLAAATKWIANGRIVIDHANGPATVNVFPQVIALFQAQNLELVTIEEALGFRH